MAESNIQKTVPMNTRLKKSEALIYTSEQNGDGILSGSTPISFAGGATSNAQGCLQRRISYGSGALPRNSWDSNSVRIGNASNETTANMGNGKLGPGPTASCMKPNVTVTGKYMMSPFYAELANLHIRSKPNLHIGAPKPVATAGYLGSGSSGGLVKCSSFTKQEHGVFPSNGAANHQSIGRTWKEHDRAKIHEKSDRNREIEASKESTCGPRAQIGDASVTSCEVKELAFTVRREKYNLQDFQTDYGNAKFYVIKSFNEDNIHRGIKYEVWSSTPNGNQKLDAAFHDAEAKAKETGQRCPVFLFFSVNRSGQFVGVAEMIGKVDFNKDMDFWQLDKWSGFFPVRWHIIKDIPNSQLRHIIIEGNDNRDVTYTRDTQEIGLKEGLQMLNIFKTYVAKTSMLDDFNFYESREKSLVVERNSKPASRQMKMYHNGDFPEQYKAGERRMNQESALRRRSYDSNPSSSLINLNRKLSLNSCPP